MQTLKKFYFGKSKSQPFVSTWKTDNLSTGSSTATQVKLPLVSGGSYNFVVQWGDGTQNNITAWNQAAVTHTYSVAGTYQITIKGICRGWTFGSTGDRLKILSIQQWGILGFGTGIVDHFKQCSNLNLSAVTDIPKFITGDNLIGSFGGTNTVINRINEWDVSKITNMAETFANSTFNQNINNWNTSSVTSMSAMFSSCPFNQPLNNWNTSNVTTFRSMFQNNSVFNQDIGSWNVSKCVNYIIMFQNAIAFNNGGSSNINNWQLNTVNSIDMSNMFIGCNGFNQNISSWNMSKVGNTTGMFSGAISFNNGLASGVAGNMFWDLSGLGLATSMFNGATSFNQNLGALNLSNCGSFNSMFASATKFNNGGSADISNWTLATTGVISMANMFNGAIAFNQPLNGWNTSRVTTMNQMFNTSGFNGVFNNGLASGVAGTLAWDTSNVTDMSRLFARQLNFNQNVGSWDVSKVIDFQYMFDTCSKFNNGGSSSINNWAINTLVSANIPMNQMFFQCAIFNQPLSNWNTSRVTNMSSMFSNATAFNNGLAIGVSGNMFWDTSNVSTTNSMFAAAPSFNQNMGALNLSKCTVFDGMFDNAQRFNNGGSGDINNWVLNTTSNISMSNMFRSALLFNQNIGNWNVSRCTSFSGMFNGATVFNNGSSPDINNWTLNTTGPVNMSNMFTNASAFNQPIGTWNTSNVTNMANMFQRGGAGTNLFNQDIGSWNVSKVTNFSSMFNAVTGSVSFNNGGSPNINNWVFSSVSNIDVNSMFYGAASFNQPIGNWNTAKFTNMFGMFANAFAFNQPIGNWDTSGATSMQSMFFSATAFNQNIGSWNVSNVGNFGNFMAGKTTATFSAANLDAIYNGWSTRPVLAGKSITFGTAKYTTASSAGRAILTGAPNNWAITDGGI